MAIDRNERVLDWLRPGVRAVESSESAVGALEWLHLARGRRLPGGVLVPARETAAEGLAEDVWLTRTRTIPAILTTAQVSQAVAQNTTLGATLGWNVLYGAISGWIFRLDMSPTEATFAQFVADWQQRNGLTANGILDFATWQNMLNGAKQGIPNPYTTAEGVQRPQGLTGMVATFGDPTTAGWEASNIQRVDAPMGREFAPGVRRVRVHRLLQPHFERLFNDVHRENVWDLMVPTNGTFYCRTKSSYGKRPCGTPGINFNQLSTHSWGITIDSNAARYPQYTSAMKTAGTPLRYPPATLTRVFQAHGFHWGLWFMNGALDSAGRINFTAADPHHFQFVTGY